jgi:hypothetical protein
MPSMQKLAVSRRGNLARYRGDAIMSYDFTRWNDLQAQAMLFNMEVDPETFQLVATKKDNRDEWLVRWQDKQDESDFDTNFDIGDWE